MNTLPANSIAVIDALTAHVALLDDAGCIVAVNEAWKRFSDANGIRLPSYGIGSNYLGMLEQLATIPADSSFSINEDQRIAGAVAAGIRTVLAGHSTKFQMEYPCHAPWEQRWFLLTITPFPSDNNVRLVVSHENITPLKAAEEEARAQGVRLAKAFRTANKKKPFPLFTAAEFG